jgi:uncharacterized repeat protein (TIGR01451 family)
MDSKAGNGRAKVGMACALAVAALVSDVDASTRGALATQSYADLAVFVSDGRTALGGPGDETTYVITVSNAGPAAVVGATIENVLPAGLSGAVWGCLEQDEVTCSTKGSGDLGDQFDLPAGSSVTYLLMATLDEGAGTSISNVVNVTPPADVVDPLSANNSAVDVNSVGPTLTVSDVTLDLESSGSSNALLQVELQATLPYPVTVAFVTVDDSAAAGADYVAQTGSLTFEPGATSLTLEVEGLPSHEGALDRRFFVDFTVTSPSGAPDARAAVTLRWPEGFYTVAPCRLIDTRSGQALSAGTVRRFVVAGECAIPETAKAIAANVTVVGPTDAGHLRVFAAGIETPETFTVNYRSGQSRAAQSMVALGPNGEVDVLSSQASGDVHLVLDVAGYFK